MPRTEMLKQRKGKDDTHPIHTMQVGHQESDLQLGWLTTDSSDDAGDVGSAGNCSVSSPREAHDDPTCVSGDAVYTSVTCNTSTFNRATGNIVNGTDSSLESDKGGMSPLAGAIANLEDICEDKIDNGKYGLPESKGECDQREYGCPRLHHNEDIKAQCSSKDLMSELTDKGPEEKKVYPKVKHDSACSSQLHTVPVGNSLCSLDLRISMGSDSIINGSISKSSYVHAPDSSEPTLCKSCGTDPVGLFTCNCTQDATETISGGSRNEAETEVHRIATERDKMNYATPPNEILMPTLVISKPEMVVDSGKAKTELCPIESISVSQTYTPGFSFIIENKVNATSSLDSSVSFSQAVPGLANELSEDMPASVLEPNLLPLSVGISALAPNVETSGVFEPVLNQNLGLSCTSTGVFSHNMSTPKLVPLSDSSASEPALVHPQLSSSCSKIQNSGAVPKYLTCSTNMNNTFHDFADNRKFSFSVPLKSKQTVADGISNIFSRPLASETSFLQDMPPKCSVSSDLYIWKGNNKSSVTVLDSFSRESSVFTGFKFCTLGSPILSSSISRLSDGSFQPGRTSSSIDSGIVFKCGAPCTESAMAASGTMENTFFKPGFRAGVNMCSNTGNTSGQNTGCSSTTESSGMSASAFVSFGKLSLPPAITKLSLPPALTTSSLSVPNTSEVSVGLFGKELRIASASSSVSSTKVTTGYQFGKHTPLSLTGIGTEFAGFSPCSSKVGFGSHFLSPKFEPLKETSPTKPAFASVFPVNITVDQKSSGKANDSAVPTSHSSFFPSGSSEMKHNDGRNAFDYVSTFKPVQSCSPSNFNTSVTSNGFSFRIPSAAASRSALFSFTGSEEKSGCSSQLNLQRRSRHSRRLGADRSLNIVQVPFKAVGGANACARNGVTMGINGQHPHMTAAPEHTSMSFEESRLQYYNNLNKQKEWKDSRAMKISKKVQTTDCILEEENYLVDMWKILECPVCLEIVTSPVWQCEGGHHVCNNCWNKVTRCPLCKQRRSRTRNYAVEAMVEKIPLPCKYRVDGCSKTTYQKDKAAHENKCRFRTYVCLVDGCNDAYNFRVMRFHLKTSHSHVMTENDSYICKGQKFSHTMSKSAFQSLVHAFYICDWGLFFLCHRVSGQNTCLWMQMVSLDPTNTDFLYSIEVENEEKLRSVTYKGPVEPLHTVVNGQQEDCLVLTNQLLDALKLNNKFCIKVFIWKD